MSTTMNITLKWQLGMVTEVPPEPAGRGQGDEPCPCPFPSFMVVPVVTGELSLGLVGAHSAAVASCPPPSPQGSFFGFCSSAKKIISVDQHLLQAC